MVMSKNRPSTGFAWTAPWIPAMTPEDGTDARFCDGPFPPPGRALQGQGRPPDGPDRFRLMERLASLRFRATLLDRKLRYTLSSPQSAEILPAAGSPLSRG
jgi:hypothetical protein